MELGQIPGQQVKPEINFYITDYRGEGNICLLQSLQGRQSEPLK